MRFEIAQLQPGISRSTVGHPLRIAQVSPLYERVPPALYGGTERVVSYLCEGLVRRGHAVTLFASGDSVTSAALRPATEHALRLDPKAGDPMAPHLLELAQVFEGAEEFDVIHSHVDLLAFAFSRLTPTPTVHTLHGRLDLPHMLPIYRYFRGLSFVSISDAQREPLRDIEHILIPGCLDILAARRLDVLIPA